MARPPYIHGYTPREKQRLEEQSVILKKLLHSDIRFGPGEKILEAGCGVGAQTAILAENSPESLITALDINGDSIRKARERIREEGISNVTFAQADISNLEHQENSFDHIFLCFVLEHISDPSDALDRLKYVLKPGGSITIIEGDHGSCFWHPQSDASQAVWHSFIETQALLKHNGLIGRELFPLLHYAGFRQIAVSPRYVYADGSDAALLSGVVTRIIVPMVQTAHERALNNRHIEKKTWEQGIRDLRRTAKPPDGTFFYTWFKAAGIK